jgi:hypothetical protein
MAEGSAAFKQEEIAQLERQLQEKRAALGQDLESNDAGLPNRELVHDVVRERIQEHVPNYQPISVPKVAPSTQSSGHQPSYLLPEFKDLVQGFINIVFNKSIAEAIKEISKTDNMALIDAFHDALTDELYGALVERRKLEVVK